MRGNRGNVIERAFVVFLLFVATAAVIPLLQAMVAPSSLPSRAAEGNPVTISIWLAFYLASLALLAPYLDRAVRSLRSEKWLVALLVLAILSMAWSPIPLTTLRRAVALCGTSLVGLYLGLRFRTEQLFGLLAISLAIVTLLSIAMSLVSPVGRMMDTGAWRGIYSTKNQLAQVSVLALTVFTIRAFSGKRWRITWLALAALAALVIIMADSKTGLLIAVAMLLSLLVFRALQSHNLVGASAGIVLAFVFAASLTGLLQSSGIVTMGVEQASQLLNRDLSTLTGRTLLWKSAFEMVLERPVLGWGYSAFWLGWDGQGSAYVLSSVRWNPGYGHSGFLDTVLGLGLVGLALLIAGLSVGFWRAFRYLRSTQSAVGLWPLSLLMFLVLANTTEGGFLQQNYYMWVLFIAITANAGLELGRPRRLSGVHGKACCTLTTRPVPSSQLRLNGDGWNNEAE